MEKYIKIQTPGSSASLQVLPGHFATNHAHVNYYLDLTTTKTRLDEAQRIARDLVSLYMFEKVVDTIVCMEGTEVIGAFLAEELTQAGFLSMNAHKSIYIVTPEFNSNSQIIFRDNILPMIRNKNIIILTATVTTGLTLNKGIESIQYYGGILQGISAVFSAQEQINGIHIDSIFSRKDLSDYEYYDYRRCPFCRERKKLDALVNPFGYSSIG